MKPFEIGRLFRHLHKRDYRLNAFKRGRGVKNEKLLSFACRENVLIFFLLNVYDMSQSFTEKKSLFFQNIPKIFFFRSDSNYWLTAIRSDCWASLR